MNTLSTTKHFEKTGRGDFYVMCFTAIKITFFWYDPDLSPLTPIKTLPPGEAFLPLVYTALIGDKGSAQTNYQASAAKESGEF